jgi:hypothetical protein
MFCVIITEIFTSWSPINVELFLADSVGQPMISHIHFFDHLCLIVLFKIPNAIELSVRRSVGGSVWPISVSVTLSGAPLWALRKHAPTSDSAAEATTFLTMEATLRIDPFSLSCSGDLFPKKNRPPSRLRALETDRYEASLWMYNIMSEA